MKIYSKIVNSKDNFPGSRDPLKNLLYSLRGVAQHSEELVSISKDVKGLSNDSLKAAKDLANIYKKYYKPLERDLKVQTELLRDFYESEGNKSMVEYYEQFLK